MTGYVAFLRAVNVGGRNRVPMAPLRAALATAGFEDVVTVLQSGNVVLRSGAAAARVGGVVASTIAETFGLEVAVVVRSAAELAAVAATNPFLADGGPRDPKTLHVAFLDGEPSATAATNLDPDRSPPDAFAIHGREIYLSYPAGSAHTRLTLDYLEQTLALTGTARNWSTVQRLAAIVHR